MKFGFVTCVQLGLSCIEAVLEAGGKFDLFMTLPDNWGKSKSGRVYLDEISKISGTPLVKIKHINDSESIKAIHNHEIDWLFIIGWSQIADINVISAPKLGVIGAHPTLLPEGRGRAAIPWAILKGLDKTGVTFFRMDEGVDTGDIVGQAEIPIHPSVNATELYKLANDAHVHLMKKIWPILLNNSCILTPQDHSKATFWEGRTPADGELKEDMTVSEVDKLVRATTKPYPGAFIIQNDTRIKIWAGEKGLHVNGLKFTFKDGIYTAIDYEIETYN